MKTLIVLFAVLLVVFGFVIKSDTTIKNDIDSYDTAIFIYEYIMDGDTSYDLLMLEGFSGVSASQLATQNITITNQTTGESATYVLTGEWQNIFYDTEAQILADFPSGLNSGNTIEISGTVTFANGCTTAVQTGTNTLP